MKVRKQYVIGGTALGVLFCLLTTPLFGQVITATISGMVRDASGAVVPGAEITIRNVDTGIPRAVVADNQGRYTAPNLSLGRYEAQAAAAGFQTEVRTGVTLTVGQQAVIDFTLSPGAVAESVTVTGEAPLVETATSSVGALVSRQQISELPLNGRSYTQLVLLQPGVIQYREQQRQTNMGMGTRMSIAGARPNQIGWRLNGLDISDAAGATPGSATGSNLGVDAIQEFQVLTNNFSAEHGKAAGGVINAVLKSGTNELHGSVFEYLRNDNLDARGFFDPRKPPLARNQFGFSVGGPIRRDHTFFFGNYEGLRQRSGETRIANVITNEAKQGRITISGVPTVIEVAPSVKPFLALWPAPNGRTTPEGVGELIQPISNAPDETYFVGKLDHTFSQSDSLSGSYTLDDGIVNGPTPRHEIIFNEKNGIKNRYQYASLHQTHIFSPTALNTFRFGLNRSHLEGFSEPASKWPESLYFIPGKAPAGGFEVGGLSRFRSVESTTKGTSAFSSYEVGDTLHLTRGAHGIKLGMNTMGMRFQYISGTAFGDGGTYTFTSLADYLQGRARLFSGSVYPDLPAELLQRLFGFFVQDDIRLTPRLTVNAGLRYEFITVPHRKKGDAAVLVHLTDPKLTISDRYMGRNPSFKNFAPRVGFAWDVFGNQKTALRAGFGLYFDQFTSYYMVPLMNVREERGAGGNVANPPFPNAWPLIASASLPAVTSPEVLEYNTPQPYRIQYNLGVQHEVLRNTLMSVNYVGGRGIHGGQIFNNVNTRIPTRLPDGRLYFDLAAPQLNPKFGQIRYRGLGGTSYYNALQIMAGRRLGGGFQAQGSYTWSKSVDTGDIYSYGTEGLTTVYFANQWNPGSERGLSVYDARHNFSLNSIYELPFGRGWRGVGGVLGGGWQVGGILSLTSGHAFSVIVGFDRAQKIDARLGDDQRPDLAPGRSNNPVNPGNVDQYFDPTAFALQQAGTLGNLGRGTLIGPGFAQVDFTMKKRFRFTESKSLEFRSEFFNLFNHANFRIPPTTNRQIFTSRGGYNPQAGRITGITGTSRQIQFSLRLEF